MVTTTSSSPDLMTTADLWRHRRPLLVVWSSVVLVGLGSLLLDRSLRHTQPAVDVPTPLWVLPDVAIAVWTVLQGSPRRRQILSTASIVVAAVVGAAWLAQALFAQDAGPAADLDRLLAIGAVFLAALPLLGWLAGASQR